MHQCVGELADQLRTTHWGGLRSMFSGLASNRTCLAAFVCGRVVIEWSAGIVAMTNDPGYKRSRGGRHYWSQLLTNIFALSEIKFAERENSGYDCAHVRS